MSQKPLILDYKQYPTNPILTAYLYDNKEQMNVVEINGKKIPFIELNNGIVELETKSFIKDEQDEERVSSQIELSNPSKRRGFDQSVFLELETKTKVKEESDDFHNPLIELETKSRIKNEGDDQENSYFNQ
ncbi:hypothetical protein SAMN04488505_1177 [Chitinophaga rupis]|uniref:Uncharacterized protein n=1 Tax=Chitinophaga rupis TaxID=573321 RepID=A0A1H8KJL2_9BACT|nr:hypothetical protein [Chitinophaga rupis]SEN93153.1 hypothetical protein SAMN04488505_1177 [Chitinophaga rupis]